MLASARPPAMVRPSATPCRQHKPTHPAVAHLRKERHLAAHRARHAAVALPHGCIYTLLLCPPRRAGRCCHGGACQQPGSSSWVQPDALVCAANQPGGERGSREGASPAGRAGQHADGAGQQGAAGRAAGGGTRQDRRGRKIQGGVGRADEGHLQWVLPGSLPGRSHLKLTARHTHTHCKSQAEGTSLSAPTVVSGAGAGVGPAFLKPLTRFSAPRVTLMLLMRSPTLASRSRSCPSTT